MSPKSVAILFAVVVALSLSGTKASPAAAKNVKTLGSASRQLNPAVRKSKSSSSGGSGDSSSGSNANESGDYAIGDCEALVDGKPFDGIQCYTGGCCKRDQQCNGADCLVKAEDKSKCFPSRALVELRSGATKRMDQVEVGDVVRVSATEFSPVFMWTHRDPSYTAGNYVKVTAANGRSLTAAAGHFVYASPGGSAAGRTATPIERIAVGDALFLADGVATQVVSSDRVAGSGLYNPQTLHGDVVVDGFHATCYTKAIEQPKLAHALLAPLRSLYKLTGIDFTPVFEAAAQFVPSASTAPKHEL